MGNFSDLMDENMRLRGALERIVKLDRGEKRTCVDFDPAGCTYEVEDIDGDFAAIRPRRTKR